MPKSQKTEDATKSGICPKCGGLMEGGVCGSCGYTGSEPTALTEDGCQKTKIDGECDACSLKDGCKRRKGMEDGCKDSKKTKADGSSRVERIDYWGPLNESVRETKPFTETPEGFYQGRAAVTCTGIFRYLQPDGTVVNEFLPPEEAFKAESLATLALKPLTNGHPKEKVTADTYAKVSVGTVGKDITNDAYNVYADISINSKDAVEDAKNGRTGLSCGYSCNLIEEGEVSYPVTGWDSDAGMYKEIGRTVYKVPGIINGMPYDKIQTDRTYNHLSLVDEPRGGDALHLRFDGADSVGVLVPRTDGNQAAGAKPNNSAQEESRMKKIRLDGATDYEVHEAVAAHIEKLDGDVSSLTSAKAKADADLAAANAALETVKKDAADLAAAMPSKIQEAVTARLALVQKADGFKVAVKHEDSDDQIKAAVVKAAMPTVNTDGMDSVKLDAHFEAACALLGTKDASASQRQDASNGIPPKQEDKADGSDWNAYQASARESR